MDGERPVNDLVALLGLGQPQVSKHLRVLREVGLVQVRDVGRQRLYRLDSLPLKPIHDWLSGYEQSWTLRFDRLDNVLAELKEMEEATMPAGATRRRKAVVTLPADNQILITRGSSTPPPHLVYRAWTSTGSSSSAGGAATGVRSPASRWTCGSAGPGATS